MLSRSSGKKKSKNQTKTLLELPDLSKRSAAAAQQQGGNVCRSGTVGARGLLCHCIVLALVRHLECSWLLKTLFGFFLLWCLLVQRASTIILCMPCSHNSYVEVSGCSVPLPLCQAWRPLPYLLTPASFWNYFLFGSPSEINSGFTFVIVLDPFVLCSTEFWSHLTLFFPF